MPRTPVPAAMALVHRPRRAPLEPLGELVDEAAERARLVQQLAVPRIRLARGRLAWRLKREIRVEFSYPGEDQTTLPPVVMRLPEAFALEIGQPGRLLAARASPVPGCFSFYYEELGAAGARDLRRTEVLYDADRVCLEKHVLDAPGACDRALLAPGVVANCAPDGCVTLEWFHTGVSCEIGRLAPGTSLLERLLYRPTRLGEAHPLGGGPGVFALATEAGTLFFSLDGGRYEPLLTIKMRAHAFTRCGCAVVGYATEGRNKGQLVAQVVSESDERQGAVFPLGDAARPLERATFSLPELYLRFQQDHEMQWAAPGEA